jgi:hypothetical protein
MGLFLGTPKNAHYAAHRRGMIRPSGGTTP